MRVAVTPHSGPTFVDFPLDHVFGEAEGGGAASLAPLPQPWTGPGAGAAEIDRAAALLREAERPVVMAGTGLYWGRGEDALQALAEQLRRPGVPQRARARAACRPTTSCSSRARARRRSARPTSRS